MKFVATIILSSGLELLGFIDGYTSRPELCNDGKLRANNLIGELVEIEYLWLENPLRAVMVPTAQGPANTLAPATQLGKTSIETMKLLVRANDILCIDDANDVIADKYQAQFSSIALPPNAGRLAVPGGRA